MHESFLNIMSWSIRIRVAREFAFESLHESFLSSYSLINENKSCMKVGKREFA